MKPIEQAPIERDALSGQVAIITGGGQGIGRETARALAHLGAAVVVAEIDAERGRQTEQLIRAEGGQALFVQTDVADVTSVEGLRSAVHAAYGPAHILVNNAEAFVARPLLEHSIEDWERVFAVNLRGAFLLIRAFLPEMVLQRRGTVITMESGDGMPYLSAYLASKVGLRSLAMSLAAEVGDQKGVAVFCFGPGMVETPGAMRAFKQLAPQYGLSLPDFIRQSAPGGRLISAELCAAGLAGAILHAPDFHGQEVYYSQGLARLALDTNGEPIRSAITPAAVSIAAPAEPDRGRGRALELNREMEAIVRGNIAEYESLSMFQRPVIKRMFQQGTGLKVEEWLSSAGQMTRRLESAETIEPGALDAYLAQLQRMADFITRQEDDARGWMRDPQQLQAALAALAERKAAVQALGRALAGLKQPLQTA